MPLQSTVPLQPTAPLQPTVPLQPTAQPRPGEARATGRPARRLDRSRLLRLALAVDALIAVVAIVLAATTVAVGERATPTDTVTSYPPVSGTLGDHLKQLEHQVSHGWTP